MQCRRHSTNGENRPRRRHARWWEGPQSPRACPRRAPRRQSGCQTSDGSFSAVSTATIASKDAFFCIFRDLQDLHSFAPLESQVEKNTIKTTWKIPTNKPLRSRARANNTAPATAPISKFADFSQIFSRKFPNFLGFLQNFADFLRNFSKKQ